MTIARARNGSGPDIVRDGLVFYFDAANSRCYNPSSQVIASDLSGQNSGEIDTGVGGRFSGLNRGSIIFNGFTHYITWTATSDQKPTQMSLLAWLNPDTLGADDTIARTEADLTGSDIGWKWLARDGVYMSFDPNDDGAFLANFLYPINTWSHIGITFEGPGGSIGFYNNGELEGTTPIPSGRSLSHKNKIAIGYGNGVDDYYDGFLSIFMMYNRALSEDEVNQNYNAHAGRFGL